MATIYSGTHDGYLTKTSATWAGARDAGTASAGSSTDTSYAYAMRASFTAGRPSGTYYITRSFFYFDTSGIGFLPIDATINFRGDTEENADIRVVKSTQSTTLGLPITDFDSIVGWSSGDNSSNVTFYDTEETTTWDKDGFNQITLSGQALVDMVALNTFKCCVIESDNDLKDVSLTNATNYSGLRYANYALTSSDPYISYTPGEGGHPLFFGTNF